MELLFLGAIWELIRFPFDLASEIIKLGPLALVILFFFVVMIIVLFNGQQNKERVNTYEDSSGKVRCRTCSNNYGEGKVIYLDWPSAESTARRYRQKFGETQEPYLGPECGYIHLTTVKSRATVF